MLSARDRRIARKFKASVCKVTPLRGVRMYGSRARGDAAPDSDLDLYVELDALTPALRERISEIAWEVGFASDMVISTLVVTHEQLETGPMGANPLIANVMREGVPV
jgi:uncharacterized protein